MTNTLIFIDTNIFLDFYRIQGESRLSMLEHISRNSDIIITSNQVQMEFKKNRQKVMVDSWKQLQTPNWSGLTAPAFLADTQLAKAIIKNSRYLEDQHKRLKNQLSVNLKNPSKYDKVFKAMEKLFDNNGPYNLTRNKSIRYKIRGLARKRFMLGYPPRKDSDTSIGDAINWEWIIQCAQSSMRNIIIVSRDNDYGVSHDKDMILNDWLLEEFKERVSRRRKIMLTGRLTYAFKTISVPVTQEEEREETRLIDSDEQRRSKLLTHMSEVELSFEMLSRLRKENKRDK